MAGDYFKPIIDKQIEDDEDDDCVIFKGSPLYESLRQSGYEMVDAEVVSTSKSENADCWDRHSVESNNLTPIGRLKQKLLNVCKMMVKIFTRHFDWRDMERENNLLILYKLKHCSTLDEDDAVFIEWFLDTPIESDVSYSRRSGMLKWFYYMISPIILSYAYGRMFLTVPFGKLAWFTDFLTIIVLVHWTTLAGLHVVKYIYRQRYKLEVRSVEDLLRGCEKFLLTIKKSIRLIQETELIARGFTLVSQRNPLSRLEEGQKGTFRQCPALRKLLFVCSRDSIHLYRERTRHLLQLLPSNPEIDVKSGYLAFEPLENYGPCLQVASKDRDCDEYIYNLTDGYSVSALKGISHLLMLHISEFIKCLAMLYHHDYKYAAYIHHSQVLNIIKVVSQAITSWTESLQRSVDFHTNSFVKKDREHICKKTGSKYDDLFTAVHSLDLHLQSALTRVRSLGTEIESCINSNDLSTTSELSHDVIDKMIQPIKAELTSCSNCYSEALNRLDVLYGLTKTKGDFTEKVSLQSNLEENNVEKGNIKELEDYIIVDQVFEAYTDPDSIATDDMEWEKPLTAEEKEKKRKEKEEALRMMTELKSVIQVRAKETEKRETAALNRTVKTLKQTVETDKTVGASGVTTSTKRADDIGFRLKQNPGDNNSDAIKTVNSDTTEEKRECEKAGIGLPDMEQVTENKCSLGAGYTVRGVFPTVLVEQELENRTKSVVTHVGVRRLRKGNMLHDSDSDEDVLDDISKDISDRDSVKPSPWTAFTTLPNKASKKACQGDFNTHKSDKESEIVAEEDAFVLGKNVTEDYVLNDDDNDHDYDYDNVEDDDAADCDDSKPSLAGLSLEEKLARYSGLDFNFTSNIALMAAAKSREFRKVEETAFGEEEEFGELSESESELEG